MQFLKEQYRKSFQFIRENLRILLTLEVPLLIIAAVIESYVTPALMGHFAGI